MQQEKLSPQPENFKNIFCLEREWLNYRQNKAKKIDKETKEAVAVIDLDTVMPGSSLYDFGDFIRFIVKYNDFTVIIYEKSVYYSIRMSKIDPESIISYFVSRLNGFFE